MDRRFYSALLDAMEADDQARQKLEAAFRAYNAILTAKGTVAKTLGAVQSGFSGLALRNKKEQAK